MGRRCRAGGRGREGEAGGGGELEDETYPGVAAAVRRVEAEVGVERRVRRRMVAISEREREKYILGWVSIDLEGINFAGLCVMNPKCC